MKELTINREKNEVPIGIKGNERIIYQLNQLLGDELTAVGQYIVHSEMCANWGFDKLQTAIKQRAVEEMKHAEKLIERILFLEGKPELGTMGKITIGSNIDLQMVNDRDAETEAVKIYNKSIRLCVDAGDDGTAGLLRSILIDEERHLDWLETQLNLIKDLGVKNYLVEQVK